MKCEWCNKEFDRTQFDQKFCGRLHKKRAQEKRKRDKEGPRDKKCSTPWKLDFEDADECSEYIRENHLSWLEPYRCGCTKFHMRNFAKRERRSQLRFEASLARRKNGQDHQDETTPA